ncbi:MAG TPA: fused MFS/spermidine synthase [Pyrinomonadaceae bacterium]|nr:fused MFS/spermidine synthase [Pyrinomonadaceae bacterium]
MLRQFRDNFLLETVVFVSGAVVMIYEIIGSRLLAPHIGTSTYIWTSLIGVILGSLSLGYWLGGRVADRKPDLKILSAILFFAGALTTLTLLLHEIILSILARGSMRLELKAIVAALVLFAPASVLFGFVTPYAVRLKMLSVEDSGKTVGRLYALSTVGSIFGTFAAGFVLLPFVGSVRSLYLIIAALFLLSALLIPFQLTTKKLYVLILFAPAIGLNEFYAYSLYRSHDLHDFDTHYSRLRVFRTTDERTQKPIIALTTDPLSTQSAIFPDDDELVLRYSRFYHLLRHFKPDFQNTLIIGGAGYTFPSEYVRKYPGKKIDVVEIDPRMTEIARRFFRLKDSAQMRIFHEDGRVFLNRTKDKYDVVLIDAFGSVYSVPFQLTTLEAVRKMRDALTEDGAVILNLISSIEGEGSLFLQAEYRTFREVFPNVYLFKVRAERDDKTPQNVILVASKSGKIPPETTDEEIADLFRNLYEKPLQSTVPVLTDDLAPVEYYNSFAQKLAE